MTPRFQDDERHVGFHPIKVFRRMGGWPDHPTTITRLILFEQRNALRESHQRREPAAFHDGGLDGVRIC